MFGLALSDPRQRRFQPFDLVQQRRAYPAARLFLQEHVPERHV